MNNIGLQFVIVRTITYIANLAKYVNQDKLNDLHLILDTKTADDVPELKGIFNLIKDVRDTLTVRVIYELLNNVISDYNSLPDDVKKLIDNDNIVEIEKAIGKIKEILKEKGIE